MKSVSVRRVQLACELSGLGVVVHCDHYGDLIQRLDDVRRRQSEREQADVVQQRMRQASDGQPDTLHTQSIWKATSERPCGDGSEDGCLGVLAWMLSRGWAMRASGAV